MTFQSLAFLLMPADIDRRGVVAEAGTEWGFDPPGAGDADVVVWGRDPLPSGSPLRQAAAAAVRRELVLARLRVARPRSWVLRAVHRLPPSDLGGPPGREVARSFALGGALVEMSVRADVDGTTPTAPDRVIDAVARAARSEGAIARLHPGSGGAALVRIRGGQPSKPLLLRTARIGSPGDPARGADALAALAASDLAVIPRPAGRGTTSGASWTTETILPGRRPSTLTARLAAEVAQFCGELPRTDGPPTALASDLEAIGRCCPRWAGATHDLGAAASRVLQDLPGVARHGDLWRGNLLAVRGSLTGVVDWDAWHPSGTPGADLLHLLGREEAHRHRQAFGSIWLTRPWRGDAYRRLTADYWRSLGASPSIEALEAVGVAWWACHTANSLMRLPALALDERWLAMNVDLVVDALMG